MKKIVFAAVFFLGLISLSLNGFAQQKSFSPYSMETMGAIDATPEQRAALKELVDRYKPKFKEVKDNQSAMSKEEYTAQWKKLTSERTKEYTKLWTPEQAKKLRELRTAGKSGN